MIFKFFRQCIVQLIIYINRPLSLFDNWAAKGRLNWMPDKWYLSFMFRSRMGYWMDWKNPKTFNEKLQWLKVYDRNPLYTKLVDKYDVRKYIAEKIGEEYLIPLLGVWDKVEDIDFEKLPNQFVLKCTHDSGSVIICKNKQEFNIREAKIKLSKALKVKYYLLSREWPYKNVHPKIIAEKFMVDESLKELKDYKTFNFNGFLQYIQVDYNRFCGHQRNLYDKKWNKMDFEYVYSSNPQKAIFKPNTLDTIHKLNSVICKEMPFVRCDWYCIGDKIYFGEMTFFPEAGFGKFNPSKWDEKFGNLIDLKQT